MGRAGLIMGLVALVAVALSSLIPVIGSILVAPAAAALIGAGAGWWASKLRGYGTAGYGAGAGALAGLGALIGSVIGLAVLLSLFSANPEFQQQFQEGLEEARQQNPDAEVPNLDPTALAAAGGVIGGFCLGLFDLLVAMVAGLIAGAVYGRNRGPAPAQPAGTYAPYVGAEPGLPQMSNTGPTTRMEQTPSDQVDETEEQRRARIYPDQ
jgi:hypothetical protein